MSENNLRMAIIGCGNMGSALAERLAGPHLFLFDRNPDKIEKLEKKGCGRGCKTLKEAIKNSNIVFLAIKPQNLQEIAPHLNKELKGNQLVVSLLTGITLDTLEKKFPKTKLIRMMPNIALQYGKGVIALSADDKAIQFKDSLLSLFSKLGKSFWISEEKINAITSLTGSGPAFAMVIIESMIDAGIAMGFNANEAKELVLQMILGSLSLLENSDCQPGEVKWQIASPAGTTIAGLRQLEECGLRNAIIKTFLGAYERAKELSGKS